jgi:hypothetical protein
MSYQWHLSALHLPKRVIGARRSALGAKRKVPSYAFLSSPLACVASRQFFKK